MTNCLAELAGSTDDETQWQHLHYQVLLNLRSDSPAVCACVIDVLRAFVDREEMEKEKEKCLDGMLRSFLSVASCSSIITQGNSHLVKELRELNLLT